MLTRECASNGTDLDPTCNPNRSKATDLDAHVAEDEVDAIVGALVVLEAESSVSVHCVEAIVLPQRENNTSLLEHVYRHRLVSTECRAHIVLQRHKNKWDHV